MSFNDIGLLVNDLLEQFVIKENAEIEKCSVIGKEIRHKLKTDFKDSLSSEMKIQRGGRKKKKLLNQNQLSFWVRLK